jgi:hypothetical protein
MHKLRCGGIAFDLRSLPCCGARTRAGLACRRFGTKRNGRCRLHGGASTGPRTPEGRARIAARMTTHGRYTKQARARGAMALLLHSIQAANRAPIPSTATLRDALAGRGRPPPMPTPAALLFAAAQHARALRTRAPPRGAGGRRVART